MLKCRINMGIIIIISVIVPFSFTFASVNVVSNAPYSVSLKQIQELTLPGSPSDIYIIDDYAYILCPSIAVINIANPDAIPAPAVFSDLTSGANSIAFSGSYAYVAQDDGLIKIVDFRDREKPFVRGTIDAFSKISKIFAYNGYLYFIRKDFGLSVYDISIPDIPISKGTQVVLGEANSLFVKNNYAYVTSVNANLTIIDISDISKLPVVGIYNSGINFYDVFVNENVAYVPQGSTGVQVLNISQPISPTHITNIFSRKFAKQVVVNGYYTWVNDDNSLQAFYSREPKDQLFAGSFSNYEGTINRIAVKDNKYVFLCTSNSRLKVLQVIYNY